MSEGAEYFIRGSKTEGILSAFSETDSEAVVTDFNELVREVEEIENTYGRELEYTGVPMSSPDGETEHVLHQDIAAEKQDYGWHIDSLQHAELRTQDEVLEGEYSFRGGYISPSAIPVSGKYEFEMDLSGEASRAEVQDLERIVRAWESR